MSESPTSAIPGSASPADAPAVDISVVVPVYNEAENVAPLLQEIHAALTPLGRGYEVIFVDDGSTDETFALMQRLAGDDPRFLPIGLQRNYGQTSAMAAGFQAARGETIVTLDGDRQNDPADIPMLLAKLDEGYDLVSGWRKRRQDTWLRRVVSRAANRLIRRLAHSPVHDLGCCLRVSRAWVVKELRLYGEMHRFLVIHVAAEGARVAEMVVNHRPRTAGESKYGFDRTFRVLLDLLVLQALHRYRGRPMHLLGRLIAWTWLGWLGISLIGLLLALFNVFSWPAVIWGWLLLAGVAGVGALSLAGMGVVAELAARAYYQATGRPPYRLRGQSDQPQKCIDA
jgi:glycosyltransferase involved in cell wall biosynthesis